MSSPRIIHISDLHFTASEHTWDWVDDHPVIDFQDSNKKGNDIASFFINNKYSFGTDIVIITGDLTDSGDEADYAVAFAFLHQIIDAGFVVYTNPGNHDYCKEGNLIIAEILNHPLPPRVSPEEFATLSDE